MRGLDLACGPGLVASGAAERGALPVALDFSSAMIEFGRADHPEIRLEESDAQALPFADEVLRPGGFAVPITAILGSVCEAERG